MKEIGLIDTSSTNLASRPILIKLFTFIKIKQPVHLSSSKIINWSILRNVSISQVVLLNKFLSENLSKYDYFFSTLKSFAIKEVWASGSDALKTILEKCTDLEVLEITSSGHFTGMNCRMQSPNLNKVNFQGLSKLRNEFLHELAPHCRNVTYLDVSGCDELEDGPLIELITNCSGKLVFLNVSWNCFISDAFLDCITREQTNITTFDMSGCSRLGNPQSKITNNGVMKVIEKCSGIVNLILHDNEDIITDSTMVSIATHLPQLNKLNIGGCELVTDVGVTAVCEACTEISDLAVVRCYLSKAVLRP